MTVEQLRDTLHIIRTETFNFCGGSAPTLDEVDSFSIMVSAITFGRLPYPIKCRVNRDAWDKAVDNTVKKIILEYL